MFVVGDLSSAQLLLPPVKRRPGWVFFTDGFPSLFVQLLLVEQNKLLDRAVCRFSWVVIRTVAVPSPWFSVLWSSVLLLLSTLTRNCVCSLSSASPLSCVYLRCFARPASPVVAADELTFSGVICALNSIAGSSTCRFIS